MSDCSRNACPGRPPVISEEAGTSRERFRRSRQPLDWGMRFRALLLIASLECSSLAVAREVSFDELLSQHQGSIRIVFPCGHWRSGGETGEYRVVEAYIYDSSFLYIQWLVADEKTGGMLVKRTQTLSPYNDDHAERELSGLRCEISSESAQVVGQSRNHLDDQAKSSELRIVLSPTGADARILNPDGTL
jgi:hypothetical protein